MVAPRAGSKGLGDWGELLAAAHLEREGWDILHRNFRSGRREIDIIARRADMVAFVEVKTRAGKRAGHPLESIGLRKQTGVAEAAGSWIERFGGGLDNYRFDAVAISRAPSGGVRIEHLEDAWRM